MIQNNLLLHLWKHSPQSKTPVDILGQYHVVQVNFHWWASGECLTKPILCFALIPQSFRITKNTDHLFNITFIFHRCRHSMAVLTALTYEYDWKCRYFYKMRMSLMEHFRNGVLVPLTLDSWVSHCSSVPRGICCQLDPSVTWARQNK